MSRNYTLRGPFFRYETSNGVAALAVLVLVIALAALALGLIMIMFGVVHSYWPAIPALGYWQTLGVFLLVQLLTWKSSND